MNGTIIKRNGEKVPFDVSKIQVAMEKAAKATDERYDLRGFDIIAQHAVRHVQLKYAEDTPTVEGVQDLVEQTLMEFGKYNVAKTYILYRSEHAQQRAQEPLPTNSDDARVGWSSEVVQYVEEVFDNATPMLLPHVSVGDLVTATLDSLTPGYDLHEVDKYCLMTAKSFIERDPEYSKVAANVLLQQIRGHLNCAENMWDSIQLGVHIGKVAPTMETRFDFRRLQDAIKRERDGLFEYMGLQVLADRYLLKGPNGAYIETPQLFFMRVAMGLALAEENPTVRAIGFYNLMSTFRYMPSTPTLLHSGLVFNQLSSCFLNTVDDDLSHIFKVLGDNAQLLKYSGGVGTDMTNLRAAGAAIKSIDLNSQGVIPFIKLYNDGTHSINRSGKRRGACVVYLEPWHLEIEDFLDLKRNTGDERRRAHDISTALWIPDLFMKRVAAGQEWTLFSPDEVPKLHHMYGKEFEAAYLAAEELTNPDFGVIKLWRRVPAQYLWNKILSTLHETGHPWLCWKDSANVRSTQQHAGVIHSSNLCTEIVLNTSASETAVCNLGSVNLAAHISNAPGANSTVDWVKMAATVSLAVRMLDNTIDLNFYPTPEAKASNLKHRPIGLGVMGLQDALYQLGIEWETQECVEFNSQIMDYISFLAIEASSMLAEERGSYESFEGSNWSMGLLPIDTLDLLEQSRGVPIAVVRLETGAWDVLRAGVRKGMRNSNVLSIAPTATIANITGVFPSIEPPHENLYTKSNMSGDFTVLNKYLVEDLRALGLWDEAMLKELKAHRGSVQEIKAIPPSLRQKYRTAFEIDSEWIITAAAARGKWIDQSQSLNLWFAGDSQLRLSSIYFLAWMLGLKTTYYLRTGEASHIEQSTLSTPVTLPEPILAETDMPLVAPSCSLEEGCEACE